MPSDDTFQAVVGCLLLIVILAACSAAGTLPGLPPAVRNWLAIRRRLRMMRRVDRAMRRSR